MAKKTSWRLRQGVLALSCICSSYSAIAADVFTVTGTVVGGTTETRSYGFNSAEDVLAFPKNLQSRFSNYTGTEVASLNIDYRGLGMSVAYPAAGSNDLVFAIPALGFTQTFNQGASREENQRLFSEFMKKNGGTLLNQIMKKLVEVSPHDPVAGNPNSMMSQMVASDFSNGFNSIGSNIGNKSEDNTSNLIGIGARFSSLRQNGINNNSVTLPFSYTIRADIDPRRQFVFNAPLTYTEVDGAKAYNLGLGAAYRLPMNDEWTLTPAVNYGAAGSKDLGAFGQAVSASLTSAYVFNGNGYDVVIGNMVGYYRTLKLSAGGYSYDPDIANVVFRNGAMYSMPVTVMASKMSLEFSLIDTRFTGTALYNEGYDEIGITLGTNKNASTARTFFRAGASALVGPKTRGFSLNFGYWF